MRTCEHTWLQKWVRVWAHALALCVFLSSTSIEGMDWTRNFGKGWPLKRHGEVDLYQNTETVRVLLAHKVDGAMLQVHGRFDLRDPNEVRHLASGHVGKQSMILPMDSGIVWGQQFPETYQFALIPRTSDHTFILDGIQHEGVLYVYQIEGKISLVNELPIESYVRSVVSSQGDEHMHPEALAALAVCVRTDALWSKHSREDAYWHIYAGDVGFCGMAGASRHSGAQLAQIATEGMVLFNNKFSEGVFPAKWTGHCGGHTAAMSIFHPEHKSRNKGIKMPLAQVDRENTKWQSELKSKELVSLLSLEDEDAQIVGLVLKKDPDSHKVIAVSVELDSQAPKVISFLRFAQLLGERIKSSDFEVRRNEQGTFIFQGYGRGSGEGLCLFSADRLAQSGKEAPEILQQFFPGTHMEMAGELQKK